MPRKKAAKKDLLQNKKRALLNKEKKLNIKFLTKKCTKAIEAKEQPQALEVYRQAQKAIDKASKTKTLHKKTAARRKSRLMKKINKAAGEKK